MKPSIIAPPVRIAWWPLAFLTAAVLAQFVPVSSTIRSIAMFALLIAAAVTAIRWSKRQEPHDPYCV
jgi:membrane protein implicated in regulation of membrane protease activity